MDFTTYDLRYDPLRLQVWIWHTLCNTPVAPVGTISDAMQMATQHNVICPELVKERKGITSA